MEKHFTELDRSEFVGRLNHFVHPSEEVSIPEQLVGRDSKLSSLRDCFETRGSHVFVWGAARGWQNVAVHSACAKFHEIVELATAVGCQPDSTVDGLFSDICRRVINGGKVKVKDKSYIDKIGAFGITISAQMGGFRELIQVQSVNYASDF